MTHISLFSVLPSSRVTYGQIVIERSAMQRRVLPKAFEKSLPSPPRFICSQLKLLSFCCCLHTSCIFIHPITPPIMESVSPLANLLEGVHNQRRNQVDEAMTQIRTLLHPSALQLVLDGSPAGLSEVIRLVLARHPELACLVKRDDGSLPLHHAASLGDIPIADLLLATVSLIACDR